MIWEYQADEAIESTPTVAADKVFFADVFGKLYAVGRDDGKEIWRTDYETGFMASPTLRDNLLVIGDVEGSLFAIDAMSGKEIWRQSTEGEIQGAAAFYEDKVLVASQDGTLYCFRSDDGTPVWKYETDDQIRCSPTVAGDETFWEDATDSFTSSIYERASPLVNRCRWTDRPAALPRSSTTRRSCRSWMVSCSRSIGRTESKRGRMKTKNFPRSIAPARRSPMAG